MPTPSLPDNPTGNEFQSMKDDGKRYRVVGTMVGTHARDAVIPAKDFGPGAQIQRLLDIGAIAEAVPAGPEAARAPEPVPKAEEAPPTFAPHPPKGR